MLKERNTATTAALKWAVYMKAEEMGEYYCRKQKSTYKARQCMFFQKKIALLVYFFRIYPSSTTAIINIFLTKVNLTGALFIHVFGKRGEKQRTLDRLGRFQERNSLFYVTSNLNEQLSISLLDLEFVNNWCRSPAGEEGSELASCSLLLISLCTSPAPSSQ